eukprot:Nitzschia sp. Nitz4//scaffold112_size70979//69734//70066//NITZ4_005914-RA/size70979-processed-gene-0.124-mRNA-1//-1//CDS//3329533301//2351//frame0
MFFGRKHIAKEEEVLAPSEFYCGLTQQVMEDPVVNMYGFLFERKAIERWINMGNEFCPCTGQPMTLVDLMSARKLKARIQMWREEHPGVKGDEGCVLRLKMAMHRSAACH